MLLVKVADCITLSCWLKKTQCPAAPPWLWLCDLIQLMWDCEEENVSYRAIKGFRKQQEAMIKGREEW